MSTSLKTVPDIKIKSLKLLLHMKALYKIHCASQMTSLSIFKCFVRSINLLFIVTTAILYSSLHFAHSIHSFKSVKFSSPNSKHWETLIVFINVPP